MQAHYFQHVAFEGLGSIDGWLQRAGYRTGCTRFFESGEMPQVHAVDLLIVMGGPMSVNDEAQFPWLLAEKRFIREMVRLGKPVLGICLGAQLIASAMGARVFKNNVKEIGWFSIQGLPTPGEAVFRFPPSVEVFHWHGETFDLPPGAIRLARSQGCENQAFQLGRSAIGLQFHLETTPASMVEIIRHCRDELMPAPYIQTESQMLSAPPERFEAINGLMDSVLAFVTRR